jgi:hypothetical protein
MYQVHAWFGLSESTFESEDSVLQPILGDLQALLDASATFNVRADVAPLNGVYFLTVTALVNHRSSAEEEIEGLVRFITQRLPGSWGLLYERDDETTAPPGPNAYRVRVVARGRVQERADPFLSPCQPTIED